MLKNKIHFDTNVEGEDFSFICPAGCQTARAFQAADEFRSYLLGKLREQQEQQAQQKVADVESKPES